MSCFSFRGLFGKNHAASNFPILGDRFQKLGTNEAAITTHQNPSRASKETPQPLWQPLRRHEKLISASLLFLFATCLGAWFHHFAQSPLFHSPAIDEALHFDWIRALAAGNGSPEIPYFRAPLYMWIFSLPARLGASLTTLRLLSTLLAFVNLLLLAQLVKRHLGSLARIALLFISLFAASWIYFAPMLLIVHSLIFWLLLSTYFYLRIRTDAHDESKSAASQSKRRRLFYMPAILSGLSLGLACISRPNALLLLPALALSILFLGPLRKSWSGALSALLAACAPILLVASINAFPSSGVFIASQGGVNFWIGNNPQADGKSATLPEVGASWERADASELAQRTARAELSPAEESSFYYRRALSWIQEEPASWFHLMGEKSRALLRHKLIGNNTDPRMLSAQAPWIALIFPWSWTFILLAGGVALSTGYPRHARLRRWCITVIALYALGILLFFTNERFRLVLIPFLIIPAADLLAHLLEAQSIAFSFIWNQKKKALLLAFLTCLGWAEFTGGQDTHRGGWHNYQIGNAHQRLGETEAAAQAWKAAVKADPSLVGPRLNLGILFSSRGMHEEAERLFLEEIAAFPVNGAAKNALGASYLGRGRLDSSIHFFDQALQDRPALHDANFNLGLALATRGLVALEKGDSLQARQDLDRLLKDSAYRGKGYQRLSVLKDSPK
jgi:tetratricopeptide (TPR) repeat protein